MSKFGACLLLSLIPLLPLGAQDTQVLPEPGNPPPVDTITPVPAPKIPYATPDSTQTEMPKDLKITNEGGAIEGDNKSGVHLGGPVKIEGDNGLEMFSDTADLDLQAKSVTLTGNVSIYQKNMMHRGPKAVYYYERKFLDATGMRASLDPILLEADKFTVEQRGDSQVYLGQDAGITTNDVEQPNFWIRAKKMTIYPKDKIVFNNMKIYAGDTPVFWLPYLSQPLDANLGYHFVPGARSGWGAYLLNTYGIMLGGETDPVTGEPNKDAWLLSRWHLDLRAKRGVGTGVDLSDTRIENKEEISGLKLYYTYDFAPDTPLHGETRSSVAPNRYIAQLKYQFAPKLEDGADWRIDSNLNKLSDTYYLEDFNPEVYRTNPAPDNTLGIYRRDDTSLLSIYTRYQLNDFYRADTRLPEVTFDQVRRPIFNLPLQHEGKTSLGFIGEQASDATRDGIIDPLAKLTPANPQAQQLLSQLTGYERTLAESMLALPLGDPRREAIKTQLLDANYGRFNTYQVVSMPMMLGSLSVVPEAGLGYTRYFSAAGPGDDISRTQFHAGVETSLKFSKDLGPYQNHDWGIDGLLHVFQPYADWSLLSTNDAEMGDPMVDRLTPSIRPQTLDPVRFTATDEMQSWDIIRMGVRNRLLTKRDGQSYDWLYVNTYMDAFLENPQGTGTFSNLYNDVRWRPLPWLGVDFQSQVPVINGGSGFSEFNSLIHFMVSENFDFALGYGWLAGHPLLLDSDRISLQTYTRLNENWGIGTRHVLELADNTLELQQYTLHRDLGNWVAGLGISQRNNRTNQEYGVVFSITLKEFPSISLPFSIDAQQ